MEGGHLDVTRLLLAAGAQPLEANQDERGFKDTPVHMAVFLKRADLLKLLGRRGTAGKTVGGRASATRDGAVGGFRG